MPKGKGDIKRHQKQEKRRIRNRSVRSAVKTFVGDRLNTSARVTGLAHRRAGTLMTVRLETVDGKGRQVTTSDYGSVYRDVGFDGEDTGAGVEGRGGSEMPDAAVELPVTVPAGLAHVYTECARIWNPIHTDVAVARAAGLPAIILHGTATLALAVSQVLYQAAADPRGVTRVDARFTGMVRLPSRLTIRAAEAPEGKVKVDGKNFHTWKPFRMGKIREDGQFDIVYTSPSWIAPDPYPAVAFPGSKCAKVHDVSNPSTSRT